MKLRHFGGKQMSHRDTTGFREDVDALGQGLKLL